VQGNTGCAQASWKLEGEKKSKNFVQNLSVSLLEIENRHAGEEN
jgi:hypothetical protein